MEIIPYRKEYKQAFIDLNVAWLTKYFVVEPRDRVMLNGVEECIANGAAVYFCVENGRAIATCMILPVKDNVWEVCKLATDEQFQGKGAGKAVLKSCMDYAIDRGARKIMLVSNRVLNSAMRLYEKTGFREVPVEEKEYERVNIQLEYEVPNRGGIVKA